ncbi:deoxyribodipyrimidine photo-lyase [Limibacillus sp. MBR-115]|jgi:deoxyribodipyrimidine photo-lyase|uniref:cryptochrome/photolyase family protein n=1 Tax=Limibacillus sp. MBR-115 TaxID=3156465 RepID=UPI0033950E9A
MVTSIIWFRRDLRLSDNPALTAAVAAGRPVVPLFILEDATKGDNTCRDYDSGTGTACDWWLHHSLKALEGALSAQGMSLVLRRGDPEQILRQVVEETQAAAIFWNRRYEPGGMERDRKIKQDLRLHGLTVESFNGSLLAEPWSVKTKADGPFKVFTPFWNALQRNRGQVPVRAAPQIPQHPAVRCFSERLDDWRLLPRNPDWANGFSDVWQPGEAGALDQLVTFLEKSLCHYREGRDRPDREQVSRLSPHLRWGEISPNQIWQATLMASEKTGKSDGLRAAAWAFLRELGWRDFSYHLLYHWPSLPARNWRPEFDKFSWNQDSRALQAWSKGNTGYPIVDAGMRQLWASGWMHNRVRMITASFLIKDLLIDWRQGAAWFAQTLVDADIANNSASWQWVAGSGADASPFFRVFNPITQGAKFDPDGSYVRTWVPELSALPKQWIHKPWEAPATVREEANVQLGKNYPHPIVDHATARQRALATFKAIRGDQPG